MKNTVDKDLLAACTANDLEAAQTFLRNGAVIGDLRNYPGGKLSRVEMMPPSTREIATVYLMEKLVEWFTTPSMPIPRAGEWKQVSFNNGKFTYYQGSGYFSATSIAFHDLFNNNLAKARFKQINIEETGIETMWKKFNAQASTEGAVEGLSLIKNFLEEEFSSPADHETETLVHQPYSLDLDLGDSSIDVATHE
jgi:hypothetical protein